MKKLAVLLVLALCGVQAFSQTVITGRLLDSSTREPEIGAVVQVFEGSPSDGHGVGYAVSDSLGAFSVSARLSSGGTVQIMNLGRKTVERSVSASSQTVSLGDILLEDDVQNLAGSTVTALKTLVRIDADKLTYDIENDTDSKTMTVLEMLRKVPMVTVDAQDNITVNGSSSFKVYVDGRPNQMLSANPSQMFKLMPASNIKSIEVITNPGAKYDAEGTGGVLDIKTKTGSDSHVISDGIYGTVTAEVNSRGGIDGGVSLNAQKGKWTFGADIDAGTDPFYGVESESLQLNKTTLYKTHSTYTGDADQRYLFGNLNASYEIDTLNLITATLGGNRFYNKSFIRDGKTSYLDENGNPIAEYSRGGESENSWNGISGSLDYQHRFAGKQDKFLTFSYQFSGHPSTGNSIMRYDTETLTSRTNDASYEHTFQADYTTPLWSDAHSLSTGLKYIYRRNTADDEYISGASAAEPSVYDYFNNIGALYAEYTGSFGKLTGKAGLRYEHTWVDVDYATKPEQNFSTSYPVLVPNLSLQWNLGMASNVSLSYNMRIRRPGIRYLNPYVDRSDKYSISYGNTGIEAERSHRLQLAWNMASPKWVLSLRLVESFGDKGIGEYSFYDTAGLLNTTYGNIQQNSRTSLSAYINWNAGTKTRLYLFGDGGYDHYENILDGSRNGGWQGNGGLGFQHTFPWDLRLSANIFASSKRYSLQGWSSGMGFGSLGLTKTFLDDRLSVSLRGQSNLGTGRLEFHSYSESGSFVSESWQRIPIRSASLSVSYTFGKAQGVQTKKTARSISNDDVVGQGGGSSISSQVSGGM